MLALAEIVSPTDARSPEPVEVNIDGEPEADKPRDIPETVSDAYLETPDISGDIPEYLSNAYEPCPSAVAEAERIVSKP